LKKVLYPKNIPGDITNSCAIGIFSYGKNNHKQTWR